LPSEWKIDTPKKLEAVKSSISSRSVKHGILSSIPMICRDHDCPYKHHCVYQQRGEVTRGDRCVLEIGKLMEASDRYYSEFAVDPTDPGQRVDGVLIQQLLTLEILIDRCTMLLSSGNLIEEIDVAMNPAGEVIQQPQLHKAAEALPKLQRRHNEILQLLSATRKDKIAASGSQGMGIDQFTKQLIERAQITAARAALIREGNYADAETMGYKYGVDQHADTIDQEPEALPPGE
jgi:hypothetical protein